MITWYSSTCWPPWVCEIMWLQPEARHVFWFLPVAAAESLRTVCWSPRTGDTKSFKHSTHLLGLSSGQRRCWDLADPVDPSTGFLWRFLPHTAVPGQERDLETFFFFFGFWDQHFPHKSVVWNLLNWLSNTFSAMHHVFKHSLACLPTTQVLLLLLRCHLFRWTSWGQEFPACLSPLRHQWDEMATWFLYPHVVGTLLEECLLCSTRTEWISKKMPPGQARSRGEMWKQMTLRSS